MPHLEYKRLLQAELLRFGHLHTPISDEQIRILWAGKVSVATAYDICCDVAAGVEFSLARAYNEVKE